MKCKICGGKLKVKKGQSICECDYCGTVQTLPKLDNKKKLNLYDRANHLRRNNDFDKASTIYEQILNEDSSDAEAYWSLVLCKYGIEYVEDPASHKMVPTVNRTQFDSVLTDFNYKSALEYASADQKLIYEDEAKRIDDIQKGILEISRKEEPFDVFICYKETDEKGRRTIDSVLANDIYHELTKEGYKVFFSRITLEDKLGTAYEPYIFAALNSAKVMLVLGTKPEYFNAVWVKNEWNRYLKLITIGEKKTLIPAYRDMDPYDLPDEFAHLQALDMSKLGFMQDLIRGIKKIISTDIKNNVNNNSFAGTSVNEKIEPLLKRAFIFLEDHDYESADKYFDRVLDSDPENGNAYLGKAMIERNINSIEDFVNYYKDMFNESALDKTDVCKEETEHISEIVDRYTVAGYLDEESIRKLYDFDRSAELLSATRKKQKEQIIEEFSNNKLLNRMQQFAQGDLRSKIREIFETYDERLSSAEKEDEDTVNDISQKYVQFIIEADEEAAKLYEDAVNKRKKEYDSLTHDLYMMNDLNVLNQALEKFKAMGDYKDSVDYVKRTEERIKEQKALLIEIELKERNKKIIRLCIAGSLIIGALAFYFGIIVPSNKYNNAISLMEAGKYDDAINVFEQINGYKDSNDKLNETYYKKGNNLLIKGEYLESMKIFEKLGNYQDSQEKLNESIYNHAIELRENKQFDDSLALFDKIAGYKDVEEQKVITEEEKENNLVSVPKIIGKNLYSAESSLDKLDLNYTITEKESANDKPNLVLSVSPAEGTTLYKGSSVELTVSRGLSKYDTYSGNGTNSVLYQVNITTAGNNIIIRKAPHITTSNKVNRKTKTGESYNVYETVMNEGYTWLRTDNNEWFPIESGWTEKDPYCTSGGNFNIAKAWINDTNGSGVYNVPSENTNVRVWLESLENGTEVTVYYRFNNGSHNWYKIGVNRWIKDNYGEKVRFY